MSWQLYSPNDMLLGLWKPSLQDLKAQQRIWRPNLGPSEITTLTCSKKSPSSTKRIMPCSKGDLPGEVHNNLWEWLPIISPP
jgi:hypothetical protein